MTYHALMTREEFIATAVQLSKEEVLHRISMGQIPRDVPDFSELHAYCDANTLGGLCDDDIYDSVFCVIFPESKDPEALAPETFYRACGEVQSLVDFWIITGQMASDLKTAEEASGIPVASGGPT